MICCHVIKTRGVSHDTVRSGRNWDSFQDWELLHFIRSNMFLFAKFGHIIGKILAETLTLFLTSESDPFCKTVLDPC